MKVIGVLLVRKRVGGRVTGCANYLYSYIQIIVRTRDKVKRKKHYIISMIRLANSSGGGAPVFEQTLLNQTNPSATSGGYVLIFNHNLGYIPSFGIIQHKNPSGLWRQSYAHDTWDTTFAWRYWGIRVNTLTSTQATVEVRNFDGNSTSDIKLLLFK